MSRPVLQNWMTVGDFARATGRSPRTLLRRLTALHAADVERGCGDWMAPRAARKWCRINESRLRAAHPWLFERRAVKREEIEEISARLQRCEHLLKNRTTSRRRGPARADAFEEA